MVCPTFCRLIQGTLWHCPGGRLEQMSRCVCLLYTMPLWLCCILPLQYTA